MPDGFIPAHGGFRKLKSYRKSSIVYDGTQHFCRRFYRGNHRQIDQMVQAARSGKQNIVEGSLASATSKRTELHLTNVAKASLGELLEDFEDFLRIRNLPAWDTRHPESQALTQLSRQGEETYQKYRAGIESESPEIAANTLRHLTIQAIYMLDRQIRRLEQDFLEQGGIRERMTTARLEARQTRSPSSQFSTSSPSSSSSQAPSPACPQCGEPMVQRTARQGQSAGNTFWGCTQFPNCRGTRPIEEKTGERRR